MGIHFKRVNLGNAKDNSGDNEGSMEVEVRVPTTVDTFLQPLSRSSKALAAFSFMFKAQRIKGNGKEA